MNSDSLLTHIENLTRESLAAIGKGLDKGADFIWPILVRQQITEGIAYLALVLFFIISIFVYAKIEPWAKQKCKNENHLNGDSCIYGAIRMTGLVFSIISVILIIGFLTCGIMQILNPEYYALQEILTQISGGKK